MFRHLGTDPPTFSTTEVAHAPLEIGNVPVVFADYDHDGDVDIAAGGTDGGRLALYRNDTDRGRTAGSRSACSAAERPDGRQQVALDVPGDAVLVFTPQGPEIRP